jgi:ACT domain-containing protein
MLKKQTEDIFVRAIVTVIGSDRTGIIAAVSAALAKSNVNILDINQTVMQDVFSMVMLVDLSHLTTQYQEFKALLEQTGLELGMTIYVQREDIFLAMHRI